MKTCGNCGWHSGGFVCDAVEVRGCTNNTVLTMRTPVDGIADKCPSWKPRPRTCGGCEHFSPPVNDLAHCSCPTPIWDKYQPNKNEHHTCRNISACTNATMCDCYKAKA